jgi:hypothetical protein
VRSAASEGEKKNAFRRDSTLDEMCDAVDERSRLARAGTGDDEQWTIAMRRCRGLFVIQLGDEIAG